MTEHARRAVEAVWHIEAGRLVAGLARVTGDVGLAEDLAQEALVVALEQWPVTGVPPNPGGWLMTTAKRRAIDTHRRAATFERKAATLAREVEDEPGVDTDARVDALDDPVGDDLLRLVFTACHPVLSLESRVALTLRCLGGLSTDEIARAFLVPDEPEAHGLLALMELQASRLPARVGPDGRPVLLPDQDRRRWDRLLVRRGLASLARAESSGRPLGPYAVQAGIAACHARARRAEDTDWARIADLYAVLASIWPSPVVEVNRAVAVGWSTGADAGLEIIDRVAASGRLAGYPHLHAVRGDLLERAGRHTQSAESFERAAALTRSDAERALFSNRAQRARERS